MLRGTKKARREKKAEKGGREPALFGTVNIFKNLFFHGEQ